LSLAGFLWENQMATDPFFNDVVFVSNFNGADASTIFIDDSTSGHTMTASGNAQLDTDVTPLYGMASLLLDGSDDHVQVTDSDEFTIGTQEFTIEMRIRWSAVGKDCVLSQWNSSAGQRSFSFNRTTEGSGQFRFYYSINGTSTAGYRAACSWIPTTDTWYDVCIDRDASNKYRIYVDGVMLGSETGVDNIANCPQPLRIGDQGNQTEDLAGNIDSVRFTVGTARYASDSGYTVPTGVYPISDGIAGTGAASADQVTASGSGTAAVSVISSIGVVVAEIPLASASGTYIPQLLSGAGALNATSATAVAGGASLGLIRSGSASVTAEAFQAFANGTATVPVFNTIGTAYMRPALMSGIASRAAISADILSARSEMRLLRIENNATAR
jgi:concanavalin A-like lectin/glucanase superfamily protein